MVRGGGRGAHAAHAGPQRCAHPSLAPATADLRTPDRRNTCGGRRPYDRRTTWGRLSKCGAQYTGSPQPLGSSQPFGSLQHMGLPAPARSPQCRRNTYVVSPTHMGSLQHMAAPQHLRLPQPGRQVPDPTSFTPFPRLASPRLLSPPLLSPCPSLLPHPKTIAHAARMLPVNRCDKPPWTSFDTDAPFQETATRRFKPESGAHAWGVECRRQAPTEEVLPVPRSTPLQRRSPPHRLVQCQKAPVLTIARHEPLQMAPTFFVHTLLVDHCFHRPSPASRQPEAKPPAECGCRGKGPPMCSA